MGIKKSYTYEDLIELPEAANLVIKEYRGIPSDVLNIKLNPKTWSLTEVCKHLVQFNRLYYQQMEKALDSDEKTLPDNSTMKPRWLARKLATYIEPPYSLGMKTLKPMYPENLNSTALDTLDQLSDTNEQLRSMLLDAKSKNLDLDRYRSPNPVFKPVKMSVTEFAVYWDAHQRRHFWQMEQILKRLPTD